MNPRQAGLKLDCAPTRVTRLRLEGCGWGWVEEGVEAYQAAHVAKPTGQTQAGSAPAPPNVSWLAGWDVELSGIGTRGASTAQFRVN